MYDSVNIWIDKMRAGGDLLACLPSLSGITEHQREGKVYYSAMVGNYKVNISDTGLSLKGSLAKYYLDDNIHTLNRGDSQRAFEKLADDLHLPIQDAKVTRIDFAQNFLMNYKPEAYYNYLGNCRHYSRLPQPQSLYYSNEQRVKLFYNKLAEVKKQKVLIPELVAGQNLLRYELRFTSRLPKQFNKVEVLASDLYDERFYIGLVNRWILEYENIYKNKNINLKYSDMNSPKDFWKQGNLHWIKLIGVDTALQLVVDMKAKNVFDKPEYYSRLKREIRELCSQPDLTSTSELIDELDEKIGRVKVYYR